MFPMVFSENIGYMSLYNHHQGRHYPQPQIEAQDALVFINPVGKERDEEIDTYQDIEIPKYAPEIIRLLDGRQQYLPCHRLPSRHVQEERQYGIYYTPRQKWEPHTGYALAIESHSVATLLVWQYQEACHHKEQRHTGLGQYIGGLIEKEIGMRQVIVARSGVDMQAHHHQARQYPNQVYPRNVFLHRNVILIY